MASNSPLTSPHNENQQSIENCRVESFMLRLIFDVYVCSRRFQCASGQRGDDEGLVSQSPRIRETPGTFEIQSTHSSGASYIVSK